ncbi:hypothetical protein HYZ97_03010 [Candidatus Pacearchaeota archaeon]|nr:hypothetical protein [Candidatus Pacearchaeota archaeon]
MHSDAERMSIQKKAQKLLHMFAESLKKVTLPRKKTLTDELSGFRNEQERDVHAQTGFRERMFANAPKKNKDNILAEKKLW